MPPRPRLLSHLTAASTLLAVGLLGGSSISAYGAAYVSAVSITGTAVNFILNEPADILSISINGGEPMTLDGTTKGAKTFNLTSASDTFAITAEKTDDVGFTIPTGGTKAATADGLSRPTPLAGYRLISNDADNLVKFNAPRGVAVVTDPNHPQFGTTYIANTNAGVTGGAPARTLQDGLYALNADQSDAFGKGNLATPLGFETPTNNSPASPNRLTIGGDGKVYVADWSDGTGGVYRISPTLTEPTQVLTGIGGPATLPPEQYHGSVTSVWVESSATGIALYTIDEDLTSNLVNPPGSTTDKNSLWRYDIATADALPFAGKPTKISSVLHNVGTVSNDFERGENGNFYLSQLRTGGGEAGIIVLSPDGSTVLFNSLTASRTLLGNPTAIDIFRNVGGIAVSPDQKYLAAVLNGSDVAVMKLDDLGVPDLASRLIVDTPIDLTVGRDIVFDAAGNIHYTSQGQERYRVLAPGGFTSATTSWDGSSYHFVIIPEPATALMVGTGALLLLRRRRR